VTWKNLVVGIDLAGASPSAAGPDDLSPACRTALESAAWLSRRYDASLHLLAALDVDARAEELILDAERFGRGSTLDRAARVVDSLAETRRGQDVRVSTGVTFGLPGVALLADVRRSGRDLVVVGTGTGGTAARGLLGSTALHLLRHCPVPLWVARATPELGIRTVVAATVLDEAAPEAVRSAATLAREFAAELHVLHVIDDSAARVLRAVDADEAKVDRYRRRRLTDADIATGRLAAEAATIGCSVTTRLREGRPAQVVVEDARAVGAEVVVIGAPAYGEFVAGRLGITAERVLSETDASLLVARPFPDSA